MKTKVNIMSFDNKPKVKFKAAVKIKKLKEKSKLVTIDKPRAK